MSSLEILASGDIQGVRTLRDNYHAWSNTGKWKELPVDYFPAVRLPQGQEKAILREILIEARMKENLSFRFWWAAKLENGDTSLFLSLNTIEAADVFDDICDKHCSATLG